MFATQCSGFGHCPFPPSLTEDLELPPPDGPQTVAELYALAERMPGCVSYRHACVVLRHKNRVRFDYRLTIGQRLEATVHVPFSRTVLQAILGSGCAIRAVADSPNAPVIWVIEFIPELWH